LKVQQTSERGKRRSGSGSVRQGGGYLVSGSVDFEVGDSMADEPAIDVFISSTCNDLTDARDELGSYLRSHGMKVRLSDRVHSDYVASSVPGTIETCFQNIRDSQYVVVLVDKRYGYVLPKDYPDYGGKSVTHAEVLVARKCAKKIFYFIRENALSEWSQLGHDPSFRTHWMDRAQSSDLKSFIDFVRIDPDDPAKENHIDTFQTSVDLKPLVLKRLADASPEFGIVKAINPDRLVRLAFLVTDCATEILADIINSGTGPALNIKHGLCGPGSWPRDVVHLGGLPEGRSIAELQGRGLLRYLWPYQGPTPNSLYCEYENRFGDRYRVELSLNAVPGRAGAVCQATQETFSIWNFATEKWTPRPAL
jgi:uncharacterized protein DUF4062